MTLGTVIVNGTTVYQMAIGLGGAIWMEPPGQRIVINKADVLRLWPSASIRYNEIDDDHVEIVQVVWPPPSRSTANDIIDDFARDLAERFPA